MIASSVLLLLFSAAALVCAQTFPSGAYERSPNYVELRVLNQLGASSAPSTYQSFPSVTYNPGALSLFIGLTSQTTLTQSFSTASSDSYTQFSFGAVENAQYRLEVRAANGTGPVTVCQLTSAINSNRQTLVLTSQHTPITESGTCTTTNFGSTTCSNTQGERVTVSCSIVSEQLAGARTCDTYPVEIQRFDDATCPVRIVRDSTQIDGLEAGEQVIAATLSGGVETLTFQRTSSYEYQTPVAGDIDLNAGSAVRKVTSYLQGSTPDAAATKLRTGYLYILHGAHVEKFVNASNPAQGNVHMSSLYVVVCDDASCERIVDDFTMTPKSNSGWLELRESNYHVQVYDGANTRQTFNNGTLRTGSLLGSSDVQVTGAEFMIATLRTTSSNMQVTVDTFDATPGSSYSDGTTRYQVRNLVHQKNFQLLQVFDDLCQRYLGGAGITFGATTLLNSTDLPAANLFLSDIDANCAALGDLYGFQLPAASGTSDCSHVVVFIVGQTFDRETQPCTVPSTNITQQDIAMADLTFVDNGNLRDNTFTPSIDVLSVEVPVCECYDAAAVCDVCLKDEFDGVADDLAAVRASLSSLVGSTNAQAIAIVQSIVSTGNNVVNRVNAYTQDEAKDAADELSDKVDDLEDYIDDEVIDAVDDAAAKTFKKAKQAAKYAEKANNQAKAAKAYGKEILYVVDPPPATVAP